MTQTSPTILMVPDAFFGDNSGGIAARYAAKVWQQLGCNVVVYVTHDNSTVPAIIDGIRVLPRPPFRGTNHLLGGKVVQDFEHVLDEVRPSHVFFLGMAFSKPAGFFQSCRTRGIRTIAFWWTQDFYCIKGYATLNDETCLRCIEGNYWPSFANRCNYNEESQKLTIRLLQGAVSRSVLKPQLQACDVVMGSTQQQLDLFHRFGIEKHKLIQCPLFFEVDRVHDCQPEKGDYIVCYSQGRIEKGWHFLRPVIQSCPDTKFVLPFSSETIARKTISTFDLGEFVESGRIDIVTGLIWRTGVNKIVAQSAGVLNLSIWPSTTEYTLLESLGLGKPVFVFDVGVHHEIIRNGENGFLSEPGDTGEVVRQIRTLIETPALYTRISTGAYRLFESLTDPEKYRSALRNALEKAN